MSALTPPARTPPIELRDAGASDLPTLIAIASEAYRADPLIAYFVRDDPRRGDALRRLFDFCLREQALPYGHVAMTQDGKACAAWLPPERARLVMSPLAQIRLLPRMARLCSPLRVPRLLAVQRLLQRHHPRTPPHVYLYLLAVAPEHQGEGRGTALLDAGLRRLDRACAYLETANERSLGLYQRHGLVVTGQARLPFDGPKLWFLWREPQTD